MKRILRGLSRIAAQHKKGSLIVSPDRREVLRRNAALEYRRVAEARFWRAVESIPRDPGTLITSTNAQVAQRLHNALLLVGGALAIERSEALSELARSLLQVIDGIEVTAQFDEMFVAYLAVGLVAFDDLAGAAITLAERRSLHRRIAAYGRWLATVRRSKPFGVEGRPGIYAWNHSIVAALALSLCGAYIGDRREAARWREYGHDRLEKFFNYGVSSEGVPYEGLSYFGICLRIIGLYGLLIARVPRAFAEYERIRATYERRLASVLEWYAACAFPRGPYVVSYNQAGYTARFAVQGILLFYGDTCASAASELWHRLAGNVNASRAGGRSDLTGSSEFESMFFLSRPRPTTSPFRNESIVDMRNGYALLRSCVGDAENRLFIKSSQVLEGPHNHSDANHFTLFLGGYPVLIDAGPGTKVRFADGNWAQYSKGSYRKEGTGASSYGHNAVLIDGKGEAPSGDGRGVDGRIVSCRYEKGLWLVSGSARAAYCRDGYNPVQHAMRHWVFEDGPQPFVLVFDDIEAEEGGVRQYERILHLPEIVDVGDTLGERVLKLQWLGMKYDIQILGGAAGDAAMEMLTVDGVAPFRRRSIVKHTVLARNPYFWLLVNGQGGASDRMTVDVVEHSDWWSLVIQKDQERRRFVRIWKASASGSEAGIDVEG